jgi:hypothetical protein
MSDIVAIVTPDQALSVAVSEGVLTLSSSNLSAPAVVESMSAISNVDITTNGQVNGSILVYNTSTSKWTATRLLESQDISGGQY